MPPLFERRNNGFQHGNAKVAVDRPLGGTLKRRMQTLKNEAWRSEEEREQHRLHCLQKNKDPKKPLLIWKKDIEKQKNMGRHTLYEKKKRLARKRP